MIHTQGSVREPSPGRELDPTVVLLSQGRFGFVRLASRTAPRNCQNKTNTKPLRNKETNPPKLNKVTKHKNQKKQKNPSKSDSK